MNVLVTGATGYLGSRLVDALTRAGRHDVIALVRPTSCLARLEHLVPAPRLRSLDAMTPDELLAEDSVDLVVHCATNYGRARIPRPEVLEANLMLPLRLVDAALRSGRRMAFINTDTMLDKKVSEYSLSKKQFREWLEAFSEGIAAVNVSLEHFFGPNDDPTKFVSFVLRALLRRDARLLLTAGEQERDFVHVDDVVRGLVRIVDFALSAPPGYHPFEIGRGEPVRLRDFVTLAKRMCRNECTVLDFGARPYRPNEVMRIVADTSRLRSLGWQPIHDLEEALALTIEAECATCMAVT